jgi:hypothetical protein
MQPLNIETIAHGCVGMAHTKQWSMEERVKEMDRAMQEQESELASQKEVAEQAQQTHY